MRGKPPAAHVGRHLAQVFARQHTTADRILERQEARRGEMHIVGLDRARDSCERESAVRLVLDRLRLDAAEHCGSALLEAIGMCFLTHEVLITPGAMRHESGQVALRAGGKEQSRLEAEPVGNAALQTVHRGIIAIDVIPDLRGGHGGPHADRGTSDGIAAQINGVVHALTITESARGRQREFQGADVPAAKREPRASGTLAPRPICSARAPPLDRGVEHRWGNRTASSAWSRKACTEYDLTEEPGLTRPQLRMMSRGQRDDTTRRRAKYAQGVCASCVCEHRPSAPRQLRRRDAQPAFSPITERARACRAPFRGRVASDPRALAYTCGSPADMTSLTYRRRRSNRRSSARSFAPGGPSESAAGLRCERGKRSQMRCVTPPAPHRGGVELLAHLPTARGDDAARRAMKLHAALIPRQPEELEQSARRCALIAHQLLITQLEQLLVRQNATPVPHDPFIVRS